jgi:hypothetical protein
MTTEEKDLILGALDSLGVALADHAHEWSEGERTIYEAAVECVQKVDRARMPVVCSGWLSCRACSEKPRHFDFHDATVDKRCWIARPQRMSKCKHYKAPAMGGCDRLCQVVSYEGEDDARNEWNGRQAIDR